MFVVIAAARVNYATITAPPATACKVADAP
jgi:hypothetical protein